MLSQVDIYSAAARLYGHCLKPCPTPHSDWHLFTPFALAGSQNTVLLRLIEVPDRLYTSEEIHAKARAKYGAILHQVRIKPAERGLGMAYYLLAAGQNLITVGSLIDIKRQSNQFLPQSFIVDFIEFMGRVLQHAASAALTFDQNQVAVDENGKFYLTNYLLYFLEEQAGLSQTEGPPQSSLVSNTYHSPHQDFRRLLMQMLSAEERDLDLRELYTTVEKRYSTDLATLVQKCMEPLSDSGEVTSIIASLRTSYQAEQSFVATMTEPGASEPDRISEAFANDSLYSLPLLWDGSRSRRLKEKAMSRQRKISAWVFLFICLLIGIGAVTYRYLTPRPLSCSDGEYVDQSVSKCLSCDASCIRCEGGDINMCISCKDDMFLVIRSSSQKTGMCKPECHGIVMHNKICIQAH